MIIMQHNILHNRILLYNLSRSYNERYISIRPVNGTMEDWINAGSSSIWTQALKALVTRFNGWEFGLN